MNQNHNNTSLRFIGEADFPSQVLQSKNAVLVAFWAPWSKPCHVIEPVLREVAESCAGKVDVVKVDADDNPDLGLLFGIHAIPTLLIFIDGKVAGKIVGTATKQAILSKLDPVSAEKKATNP